MEEYQPFNFDSSGTARLDNQETVDQHDHKSESTSVPSIAFPFIPQYLKQ
jgi:hypothetical protein